MVQVNFTEAKYDVVLVAGDGWSQGFVVSGLSLAGATVTCALRSSTGGSTGVTITPVVVGSAINLTFTGANTTTLAAFGSVVYTVVVTPSGGQPRTLVSGTIMVVASNSGIVPSAPGSTVGLSLVNISGSAIAVTAYLYGQTGVLVVTSGTRPGSPTAGQFIFETDTLRTYVWSGTAWAFVNHTGREDLTDVSVVPGGNIDATATGAYVDWITLGSIAVPVWATRAYINLSIIGVQEITAANTLYDLRTTLGGMAGVLAGSPFELVAGTGVVATPVSVSFPDRISAMPTGAQSLKIQALRAFGTGQWRVNTSSRISATIQFA